MKLDELKKMIAEEFESYMKEDEVDVSVGADDVDMDADIEPGMGEEQSPEDALEKIYQMLQAYFEGDGEDNDMDGMTDEPGEDVAEADLEENSSTEASVQKTGMKPFGKSSAGANAGYGAVGGKGSTGYDAGSKALQERFQKLANIKTLKG
jgi:hypothetical protein